MMIKTDETIHPFPSRLFPISGSKANGGRRLAPVLLVLFFLIMQAACAGGLQSQRGQTDYPERICPPSDGSYGGLDRCTVIGGDLVLTRLDGTSLPDLRRLHRVEGSLLIGQSFELESLRGLQNLRDIGGDLHLVNLPNLTSLDDLNSLRSVGGEVHIIDVGVDKCGAEAFLRTLQGRGYSGQAQLLGLDDDVDCAAPQRAERAELPIDSLPDIGDIRRGNLLEGLHPELQDRARLLYGLLESEGIDIVFISGHRRYVENYRPNRLATWHNLGMAFDLNIVGRDYNYYDEDEEIWNRIGEIATGLGLIWGIRYNDIFHFEWHPGFHARIREHEFSEFQELAGSHLTEHHRVWHLFDEERPNPHGLECFGGCHEIPDDGLRELLEALR